ncbi:S-adenosyl-L-methionine-dependent methyltransferase [Zychaea mexicana]|uniref:S-adenosyl-L-methionine-dependent methyltransferase n=1 Tax=Zychaea mexicana TaxID=64656 RepID=UPI0022FE1065|nr:S-adenosyl-L-methionine-dependent methyltransferase [Zychaea mexicana]KAI9494391.1 S-adenosyl-L-methionine-dependent methyltransferase [Zychaea mexicana]
MTSLPRLPSVRDIVKLYGLSAKSQLGQNFILDKNITDKIVRSAHLSNQTPLVVEIGPGPGLLTRSILDSGAKHVQLSEATQGRLRVLQGNALTVTLQDILEPSSSSSSASHPVQLEGHEPLHIMGNLPFNVASPLLMQWLHQSAGRQGLFGLENDVWMTLMFQKEVGERLSAKPSTEHRGRLSVMAQSLCQVKTVYAVPSTVFVPRPKVDASVVQLKPRETEEMMIIPNSYKLLEEIVRYYFTKRRKAIGHISKRLAKDMPQVKNIIDELETVMDFKARPEDIPTDTFCSVANLFHQHNITTVSAV